MIILADVIIPAFAMPYLSPFLFPVAAVAALLSETIIFKLLNRRLGLVEIVCLVLLANLASTILGFIIAIFLPTGLVDSVIQEAGREITAIRPGPRYAIYCVLGYFLALVLSIPVEYQVVRQAKRWAPVESPFKTVAWANVASYLVLAILSILWWRLS